MGMQTGGQAASAGVEFMFLMEALRSGAVFVEAKGQAGSVEFPDDLGGGSIEGFRVTDMPSNKWIDIEAVRQASADSAGLQHAVNFLAAGNPMPSEVSKARDAAMAAFAAVNKPENASDALPAYDDEAAEAECADLKAAAASILENTKPAEPHAPVPYKDTEFTAISPPEKSVSPEEAALASGGVPVETGVTPKSDEPVPAEATQPGKDRIINAEAGPKGPLKATGLEETEPRQQIPDEKTTRADEAALKAASRSEYPAAAVNEDLGVSSSKPLFKENTQSVKDPIRPVSGPEDTELPVDAEASGTEGFDKRPVTEDLPTPRPSFKTASPDPSCETVLNQSSKHIAFGALTESSRSYGPGQAPQSAKAANEEAVVQENADTVQAESGEEFSLTDDAESGLRFEFSHGEGGETHYAPQAERPVGTVAGIAFRSLVDTPSAVEKPMTQAYAIDIEEQLGEAVRISVRNGGGEVRMKLNPEHLGELAIKLSISKGAVTAEITAESLEAKALLESNSTILKDSLAQQGLTLRECVISVNSRMEAGLPERREGLFEERREEAHGSGHEGKNGRKNGYSGGSGQRKAQPAYGGIDLFA